MTIYEFYMNYVLLRKAVFLRANHYPLNASILGANLKLDYRDSIDNLHLEIEHNLSITDLHHYGIKIALITEPVFIDASILTGVISIPVPIPDELPF